MRNTLEQQATTGTHSMPVYYRGDQYDHFLVVEISWKAYHYHARTDTPEQFAIEEVLVTKYLKMEVDGDDFLKKQMLEFTKGWGKAADARVEPPYTPNVEQVSPSLAKLMIAFSNKEELIDCEILELGNDCVLVKGFEYSNSTVKIKKVRVSQFKRACSLIESGKIKLAPGVELDRFNGEFDPSNEFSMVIGLLAQGITTLDWKYCEM